ncbi:caspase, EACC1-associated type [Streptomyces sp. H27-D2]|uniref:caspase, EACC1-associated type n=1 Tax=Streptomyces sp. H27-D2 TaxID=3046304 RepID=UPI002DBB62C0|nr:AAA domain-containing protein [Streptomyces sp. H27-D2]MEC4014972.1 AAA domain-containing protein [Streptomyces sp. H27-D2]
MDNDRYAMLIGVSSYDSAEYHELPAVRADLHYMQAVLESTEIGMYNDCAVVAEPTRAEMLHAIEAFLGERQRSDTALLYFSGHGAFCETDSQLYFLTRDADKEDLPGTAVSAEFLERMLQDCRASSKIVLLDCCSSGSVVQGWSSKGSAPEETAPEHSTLLRPTGVYFITASDALQAASAMAPPGSSLGTSRFTGEIVEGLRNGRIKDGGWITPDDLFTYLGQQMARNGVPEEQRPTKSTIRATRSLPFARSVAQPVFLPPLPGSRTAEAAAPSRALLKARERAETDAQAGIDWQRLITYYVSCIGAQTAAEMMPERERGRDRDYFLLGSGDETVQAGLTRSFPAPQLPKAKDGRQNEYWYGYPAITLPSDGGAGRGKVSVRLAPLLLQQMELVPDSSGRATLRPSGVPSVHTGLLTQLMSPDEAAELVARWQPSWQEGNGNQMLRAVRELLKELSLPELEPLDISALSGASVMTTMRPGAHNAAMLLVTSGSDKTTEGLVDNLLQMSTRAAEIAGTALGALLPGEASAPEAKEAPAVVVSSGPCNESQESVIRAAMEQSVTVATGPPGTGKSEVVTALVTTCVQAGKSVLVASTNNEAVNVVAERCDEIAPGLLFRTGNVETRVREAEKLEGLLRQHPDQPDRSSATVAGELRNTHAQVAANRQSAARHVREELRLSGIYGEREAKARALDAPVGLLSSAWAGQDAALDRWEGRARRALRARWFARWRRARAAAAFIEAAGSGDVVSWTAPRPTEAEQLELLADFAGLEVELRSLLTGHAKGDEQEMRAASLWAAARLSGLSGEASRARSAEKLRPARDLLNQRLQVLRQGRGYQKSQKNLMAQIKGWAISTHSVRQLELSPRLFDLVVIDEASQCSIPSVLPLLFRAKRALIIGDPMQLGHIASISPQQERQARERAGLSAAWLEEHRLSYRAHSSYHAAAQHGASALLLDEHYRCHPQIAHLVNGYCYAGQLRVLTDVRRHVPAVDLTGASESPPVLCWVDVPDGVCAQGSGGGSWRNPGEAAAVEQVVAKLLRNLPEDATIGVVTPFRAQKEYLERALRDDRVRVGTVHAFQGGQRDIMVLSLVATHNTPAGTTHWVAGQVNLWNVAITRAKSQLITVGQHAFWKQHAGLPAKLAEQSALVAVDSGTAQAEGTLTPPHALSPSRAYEALADRLQAHLGSCGITAIDRSAAVGGHPVDFVVTVHGENIAVLIDEGPAEGEDHARHLRLTHARGDLLVGLPSGGIGAKPGPVARSVRVPAWQITAGERLPGLTC